MAAKGKVDKFLGLAAELSFSTVFLIKITSHTVLCSWNACFGSDVVKLKSPKRKSMYSPDSVLRRCSFSLF